MKKYKISRRRGVNIYIWFIIISIEIFLMSFSYAMFSDTMEVSGTANIKRKQISNEVENTEIQDIPNVPELLSNDNFNSEVIEENTVGESVDNHMEENIVVENTIEENVETGDMVSTTDE